MADELRIDNEQLVFFGSQTSIVRAQILVSLLLIAWGSLSVYLGRSDAAPFIAFGSLLILVGFLNLVLGIPKIYRDTKKDKGIEHFKVTHDGITKAIGMRKKTVSFEWSDVSQIVLTARLETWKTPFIRIAERFDVHARGVQGIRNR